MSEEIIAYWDKPEWKGAYLKSWNNTVRSRMRRPSSPQGMTLSFLKGLLVLVVDEHVATDALSVDGCIRPDGCWHVQIVRRDKDAVDIVGTFQQDGPIVHVAGGIVEEMPDWVEGCVAEGRAISMPPESAAVADLFGRSSTRIDCTGAVETTDPEPCA